MNASKSLVWRTRIRRSVAEWGDIIHQYEQSGQTQAVFCDGQSLALSTFSRWRQKLISSSRSLPCNEAQFVELSSCVDQATELSPTPWDVELQLGADIVLRLRRSC